MHCIYVYCIYIYIYMYILYIYIYVYIYICICTVYIRCIYIYIYALYISCTCIYIYTHTDEILLYYRIYDSAEVSGASQQPITDLEAEVQRTSRVAAYLAQVTGVAGGWLILVDVYIYIYNII